MSTPSILILTSAHLCRNPRVLKEAATLGGAGYDVTVLTTSHNPRLDRLDAELVDGQPFRREAVYARVSSSGRRPARLVRDRAATWLARKLVRFGGLSCAHALGPASTLLRLARARPATLTLAHTELPLWVSLRLHDAGRRVAVDLEDWYSEDLLPEDRRFRPLRLLRQAEGRALHQAAYVSTTSRSLSERLAAVHQARAPVVIRNVFPLQPRPRPERGKRPGPVRLVWFSQTIGPGRGLEPFVQGWARTTGRSRFSLIGEVSGGFEQQLRRWVPAARQEDLRFEPPVRPAELADRLADDDVGLALEQRTPASRDLTVTNKLFQYLNAGLAVLATDTSGQREILQAAPECGTLLGHGDPSAVAAILDQWLANPDALAARQHAARAAAEREFCWEREAPRLLAAVQNALGPRSHPIR